MWMGRHHNGKILITGYMLIMIISIYIYHKYAKPYKTEYTVIVWWNPYDTQIEYHRKCGYVECRFTSDRVAANDPFFKGYLFHGTNISISDLPFRKKEVYWSLYYDSSPKNVPFLLRDLDLFNFTSTFSRYSDIPLTLQSFISLEELIDYKKMYSFGIKTALQRKQKLAPVLYIESHCETLTGRELYVTELGKYISIDSYGTCLKNKSFPNEITNNYKNTNDIKNFYDFVSKYKFTIIYQDLACDDYITDNFWKSLTLGVIPIYFGAPNIRNYFPNPNSVILIDDFKKPADLAEFLTRVSNNEDLYISFLLHKTADIYPIANQLLVDHIYKDDIYYVKNRKTRSIASFECYVCEKITERYKQKAEQRELYCKIPHFPPGNVTSNAMQRVSTFLERMELDSKRVRKLIT
ncbi:alpha-(1,3)-fucosyltransferase 10 [Topomyia yanbarensis]|uniref:alpha-(1,3)-fucosyltransferase 10 n=1 Tax=Topomyia yanbarensis TaxID=2498891 RepID=UPI00273C3D65|nr:alpha-(1,3)-fucosyltransferase 10 [Topomyia yanbarensis]